MQGLLLGAAIDTFVLMGQCVVILYEVPNTK